MLQLMARCLKYNLSAHFANLPNLLAGALGMLLNNTIFLLGMWGMLFAGKPENQPLLFYYIALNALIMTAWGGINFFFGGWMDLGELIVSGQFESKLSTPRHPLILVSTHVLHPSALGDLLMGLVGIFVLIAMGPAGMGLRTLIASGLTTVALFSLYIFSGSLAFFISRGNVVALLIREMAVSLSSYPMGKIFPSGMGRIALLITPAAAVSLLPMDWIEGAGNVEFAYASGAVLLTLVGALWVYSIGVKRFQATNLIGAQS
jgi:ABC-type uncharacterized transport system permease subunit